MENQSVFKFVSIRPPTAKLDKEHLIEAGSHADSYLAALGTDLEASDFNGRLLLRNKELLAGKTNPLNLDNWSEMFFEQPEMGLLKTDHASLEAFTESANTVLNRYRLKLGSPETMPMMWFGYLIHILSGEDTDGRSLFFHRWIHLLNCIENGKYTDLLPVARLVLPHPITRAMTKQAATGGTPTENPLDSSGGATSQGESYWKLTGLLQDLKKMYVQKKYQAVEQTRISKMEPVKAGSKMKDESKARRTASNKQFQSILLTMPARTDTEKAVGFNQLDDKELSSESLEIIREFDIDTLGGNLQAQRQVKKLLAEIHQKTASQHMTRSIDLVGKTFIYTNNYKSGSE